ncbi:MAG: TonB-dependent receptor [Pseudomonadota bacterium]
MIRKNRILIPAIALIVFMIPYLVLAESAKTIKLDDMFVSSFYGDAVTITPTRTIIDVDKFIASGRVERVEDILSHLGGIDVMRTSAVPDPQQVVMMRGFDDSRFVVALDGRPITSPTAGADTFVDWSSLVSADIEKIEVIRAGASALYENAQGGVINLITKKGTKRETLAPKTKVQVDYASNNTQGERATLDGGIGDLTYFLNIGHQESDGYLRNNDWRSNDSSARLTYTFPSDGQLVASVKQSDLDQGYAVVNDPSRSDWDPDYPTVRDDAENLHKFRSVSYPGGKNEKHKVTGHYDLIYDQPINDSNLKLHFFRTSGEESSYYYILSGGKLTQTESTGMRREEDQLGLTTQYRFNVFAENALTLGHDYRTMETGDVDDLWRVNAGYFDDAWSITDKLSMNTGLRYIKIREWTYPMATPPSRFLLHDEFWLPKWTLGYSLSPKTKPYVSINREFHLPGCCDRPVWAMSTNVQTEELQHETSWHYDLGVHQQIGDSIDTRFGLYYIDIEHFRAVDSPKNYYSSYYAYNLKDVSYSGVEFEFNANIAKDLGLYGNYTYRHTGYSETEEWPVLFWLNLPPEHKAKIGARYNLFENTLLTTDYRYVGDRGGEGSGLMDSYTTTDVGMEQTLSKNTKLLIYVNNLFGNEYEEVYGFPMQRQTYGAQVTVTMF